MAISGLAGKNSWELALIDQFCDLTEDMYREVLKEFYEKNEAKKVGSVVWIWHVTLHTCVVTGLRWYHDVNHIKY